METCYEQCAWREMAQHTSIPDISYHCMLQVVKDITQILRGTVEGLTFEKGTTKFSIATEDRISEVTVENLVSKYGQKVEVEVKNGSATKITFSVV